MATDTDDYASDFKEDRKNMITEVGYSVSFQHATFTKDEGGQVTNITFGTAVTTEKHKVRTLNRTDELVKEGLFGLEDIEIEAPYDTVLAIEDRYLWNGQYYTILQYKNLFSQGTVVAIQAIGKRFTQQQGQTP